MASLYGVMITLSPKRLAQIESDPFTLDDVLEARHDEEIPGLLDLGVTWDALDVMLSDRGAGDAVLGDAILGRAARKLTMEGDYESAHVIDAKRVIEISKRLDALDPSHVKHKYPTLAAAKAHGKLGAQPDEEERDGLAIILKRVIALYKEAAKQNHQMLVMVIP